MLIKILCCKQENEYDVKAYDDSSYTLAAFTLGLLYYNLFCKEGNVDIAWLALYCLSLAMIRGNDLAVKYTTDLPVAASREVWDAWCYDARNLLYNPRW